MEANHAHDRQRGNHTGLCAAVKRQRRCRMSEECPRCGQPMTVKQWLEDGHIVETYAHCGCGYTYHWAYGSVLADGIEESEDML
jgi:hypothetical protein